MIQLFKIDTAASRLQFAILIVAFLLFCWAVWSGIAAGTAIGRTNATYQNVSTFLQALKQYHADQGVYPSAEQVQNQKILALYYISDMPAPVNPSGICKDYKNFDYSQTTPRDFSVTFCLERPVGNLAAGLQTVTQEIFSGKSAAQ